MGEAALARLTWFFPKKRGLRRTGSKLAGRVGEAAFFLGLFVLGCAGLITLVSSYVLRTWPVEQYFPTVHFVRTDGVIDDSRIRNLQPESAGQSPRFDPQLRLRFSAQDKDQSHWLSLGPPLATAKEARAALNAVKSGEKRDVWFDPATPTRSTLFRPRAWGLWLAMLLLVGLVASGVYGVLSVALVARTSAERRQAMAKAARSSIQLAESNLQPPVEYPTVPLDINLTNSPGLKLKYRLPAVQDPAWWDPLESTCRHASLSIL